jgi:flagellar export protein FliJ
MKTFKFRLTSILKLRESAETEAQQNHAAAGRRLDLILTELTQAQQDQKQSTEQLSDIQKSTFRPSDREILWNALKYQQDLCARLTVKAENARKDLEHRRQELLAARADHQALLKILEKDRREHTLLAEQEERSMIDDIVNARHAALRSPARTEAHR